jgi:hypothetical protein
LRRAYARTGTFAAIAFVAYIAYGIYDAGLHDRPAPPANSDIIFKHGNVTGQRITTKSWSADYDKIVSNADQTVMQLDDVRNGVIFRNGKPYLRVRAAHMTVNTISRDFTATGPLHVETINAKDGRSFDTTDASWNDTTEMLTMTHHITIRSAHDATLSVGSLSLNVKTGEITLTAVNGPLRFK